MKALKPLTGAQIRQMYLDFFQSKGHAIEPSASLVPVEDPSLLWINSGVATLKKYFDGRVIPDNPRIVNAQKSIRTNDIENVGKTARHHTFFEMLGNFSVGDYFREDAIKWGWELLTSDDWYGLDPERLSVTIHPEDDAARQIWLELGVPAERIIPLEDNFWEIGEGPSGPNTEIFFDRGPAFGDDPNDSELYPGGENERYLEIWNIVFSQYNHDGHGNYTELPRKNIDTGMGLERMACVMQDVPTNFDTDLFMPIIHKTEEISGKIYRDDSKLDVAFKVIADHIRTVSFAIGDGALPSNEGRGYVLRRLLRRAVRYAKMLGIERPFMYELVDTVGNVMVDFYPQVPEKADFIKRVIKNEEERFHETLHDGLAILNTVAQTSKANGEHVISGEDAFRLYDTYGFPLELTVEYAEDHQMSVDEEGFKLAMDAQRQRARAAREESGSMQQQSEVLSTLKDKSTFVGYTDLKADAKIIALLHDGERVTEVAAGEEAQVILDITPFYAESGGEVADTGTIEGKDFVLDVKDVQKAPNGQNLHTVIVRTGIATEAADVVATVEAAERKAVTKNHTATHLLHKALKDTLGTHVNQAGSLVSPDRLRFDFSHFGAVTQEELTKIEQDVNQAIWASLPVDIEEMNIADAKAKGAMALFGEKYGETVRVVSAGTYSIELCGGIHVGNTAEIGLFKIVSESGIGAGTRRIEAVTGAGAYRVMNQHLETLEQAAAVLKTKTTEVPVRIEALQQQLRETERANESLQAKLANIEAASLKDDVEEINGVRVLAKRVDVSDMDALRGMMDELKSSLGSAIIVLGSAQGEKVNLVASVSKDLIDQGYHAGKLIKEVATRCGGGGGGRPDMAQAGGKDASKLEEALAYASQYVQSLA
ncbi:alanine--tRNA ligase [Exiguobacterium indicum]|uniref:Alanine--tRNA ligase n=1 Tax=Exiguobacterium indicum TaxID=296995 RepID=A0ABU8EFQ9_9BACL|nr:MULTISPECIES: alanine--tRNA ligase [unclassified Exiguobacterium]MBF8152354.1 alanine--tRNA ligase [Exiguobacterium sp. TBG-PICH-001]NTY10118.1 alanine--tRNA ligase [Exiguobacterium sp. JMULE1]OAI89242.1 alanine--tRNA ligase [Exiguobacterium sp. KKBO11]